MNVLLQTGTQASAVASVLQEPADKFGNDVCFGSFAAIMFIVWTLMSDVVAVETVTSQFCPHNIRCFRTSGIIVTDSNATVTV